MSGPENTAPTVPAETYATSTNRPGTVAVRANDQGLPVEIRVDRRELRYGAQSLADEILRLSHTAATQARARRRIELAEAGVPTEVLDRLGLPKPESADGPLAGDDTETGQNSWMRPL